MKNKKVTTITPENPYYSSIKGYTDLRATDKINVSIWRVFGLLGLLVGVIGVSGMAYIGAQTKFVPMVFYTDSNGSITYGGVATQKLVITEPMISNQLAEYIVSLRQIPLDLEVKSQYMKKVKVMSSPNLFDSLIYPQTYKRYSDYAFKTVKVNIKNIIPVSKNVYQIDWVENIVGNDIPIGKYKGNITFTLTSNITDPAVLLLDPLGLVVSDLNINQEISN